MSKSINAYNDDERVRRYDMDMDLMHPNRHKMINVALEVLPYDSKDPIVALDLGVGTGFFASRFLDTYPNATLVGLDGSEAMIQLASSRLSAVIDRVRLITSGFGDIETALSGDRFDLVFSSYALHHLDPDAKAALLRTAAELLKPGGWFLNADLVSNNDPAIERIIQDVRARGILSRNAGKDSRFTDLERIREFLDGLEESEGDQPLTIEEDLRLLRECGIKNVTTFWQEYREVVYGGFVTAWSRARQP
jgi:tRNA (cmo5U34)-methyltransferase